MRKNLGRQLLLATPLVLIGGIVLYYVILQLLASTPEIGSIRKSETPASPPSGPAAPAIKGDVYTADFTATRPPEFSSGAITATKTGGRKLLGPIPENTAVTFTLGELPQHQLIHLTFDVAFFYSWNGSSSWGPDLWMAEVVGGQKLLTASFSNCGFFDNNNSQTYPDTFPMSPSAVFHEAWTGAAENQTLGAAQAWYGKSYDPSSVYHMDWTFPHSESSLQLKFSSKMAKKGHARSFGFLAFKVEPLASAKTLSDGELETAWTDLSSEDAVAADAAVWKLIAAREQTIQFFSTKLIQQPQSSNPFFPSRLRHVLEVLHSDAAQQLLPNLPAETR